MWLKNKMFLMCGCNLSKYKRDVYFFKLYRDIYTFKNIIVHYKNQQCVACKILVFKQ